jgi:alpha-L-fucosidase 2
MSTMPHPGQFPRPASIGDSRLLSTRLIALLLSWLLLGVIASPAQPRPAPERGFVSSQPAPNWEQALISGNGKFGALVYGQPLEEIIVLNHARLFMPLNQPLPPVDTGTHLKEIRQRLAAGDYQRAADLVVELSRQEGYGASAGPIPLSRPSTCA